MKKKVIREINQLIAKGMEHKHTTVHELESRARNILENYAGTRHDFYRGFLRAIEMLRASGLLKEEKGEK